ncbi:hypothetical protein D3C76_980020 [compost metagenome]
MVFLVGRADLGVGTHHVGHQGNPRGIGSGLGRVGIGLGSFDATLEGAPEVKLVGRADDGFADVRHRYLLRQQEGFTGLLQALRTQFHPAVESALGLSFFDLSTRPGDIGRRNAQFGVGRQGLADQRVQTLIVIQMPPVLRHRRRHHTAGILTQLTLQVGALHRRLLGQ